MNEPLSSLAESQPLVSIIISSYNYEKFIATAVESVLDQTYRRFEIVAIDDGSTDASLSILRRYNDSRLRVISQPNSGQAAVWNRGFLETTGDIVAFLDSDDWWEKDKLQRIVQEHLLRDGKYGVLQHNLLVDSQGAKYPYRRTLRTGDCFSEMRATGDIFYFVTSSGLAFSRKIVKRIFPLPVELRISPDAYLTRTAFCYGQVISIPEFLGTLRLHGDNAGMTQSATFHEELRNELIFPLLNRYYSANAIDFSFVTPSPSSTTLYRRLRRAGAALLGR